MFDRNIKEIDELLSIMYWLSKLDKTLLGARFIEASKNCNTKPLSDTISKTFKIFFIL